MGYREIHTQGQMDTEMLCLMKNDFIVDWSGMPTELLALSTVPPSDSLGRILLALACLAGLWQWLGSSQVHLVSRWYRQGSGSGSKEKGQEGRRRSRSSPHNSEPEHLWLELQES